MNEILEMHRRAMEFTDGAFLARQNGDAELAKMLFRQAFECERDAADMVANADSLEPTRSVMHRSAATLAFDCGEFREAERLIARALVGSPPEEIADELRMLLEQVYDAWGYRKRKVSAQ